MIGEGTGWGKYEFFAFLATTLFVNSVVQAFFMPNADEFSELIRTGALDFALLKPIDTQFLDFVAQGQLGVIGQLLVRGAGCWAIRCTRWGTCPPWFQTHALYPVYLLFGVADSLQPDDRHGRHERVDGPQPESLQLLVLYHELFPLPDGNLRRSFRHAAAPGVYLRGADPDRRQRPGSGFSSARCRQQGWWLVVFALFATVASLLVSRLIFTRALLSYRSASS